MYSDPSTVRRPTSNPVKHVSTTNSSHVSSESVRPTDVFIESEPKSGKVNLFLEHLKSTNIYEAKFHFPRELTLPYELLINDSL